MKVKRSKQPKPAVDRVIGRIKMTRVFPAQPSLEVRVIGDVNYLSDPDGDCPLANTRTTGVVFATGSAAMMDCFVHRGASDCKGEIALPALLAVQCTDVAVLVENVHVEVYDIIAPGAVSSLIARDGMKIAGDGL